MSEIQKAKARLMLASFELGQAQRALEDAEEAFRKALNEVDFLENQGLPTAADVRGILSK